MDMIVSRIIEPTLEAAMATSPIVILEGGRAVGKSTLCDILIDKHGWQSRVDLSDADTLALLRLDPVRFLAQQSLPCVIDEAQIEPELTIWLKHLVDQRNRQGNSGQFLLTGSARLGRNQLGGSDPLVGRAVRHRMWSLTRAEIDGARNDFIGQAFGDGWSIASPRAQSVQLESLLGGGLPGVVGVLGDPKGEPTSQWEREIATYVEGTIPLGAAGTRADLGRLLRTFRYLAATSAQLLNVARAADELGVQANTVRNHIELLEAGFLLERIEAERPSEQRVVSAHPRVIAADTGLATWAARGWTGQLSAALRGSLFETQVAHDLSALADAHQDRIVVRHWRDNRRSVEVDLLLVHPDGRHVPIEVKVASSVHPRDVRGLTAFAETAGSRCTRAILIYTGDKVLDLSQPSDPTQIYAIPFSLL